MFRTAGLCALMALTIPTNALSWGASGHRMIGREAVRALPPDLPAFLRTAKAADDVGELSREPDRWKAAGKPHDSDRDPAHFLDVLDDGTILGGPRLSALPETRPEYEAALARAGADSWRAGYLPYAMVDGYLQLAKDFTAWRAATIGLRLERSRARRAWLSADRTRREALILRDLGVLSHYVGDGSQPLHATAHFNGWGEGPNPEGFTTRKVHQAFEGTFVAAAVSEEKVRAAMAPYRACHCAASVRVAAYLQTTADAVLPFYRLEKAGGFEGTDPRGAAFAEVRLAAAASELRDMTFDAWKASLYGNVGYPPTVLADIEAGRASAYDLLRGVD